MLSSGTLSDRNAYSVPPSDGVGQVVCVVA
jgi:hypothetical protein